MADRTRSILVKFLGDSSGLSKATGDADGKARSLGDRFKDLGKSMGDADGVSGKLKAGFGGVKDIFSSSAVQAGLATGAVGGLVAVGAKAVTQFMDTTLEVGKFRDATGTTADEASRFTEVFNDLGIGSETGATAIGKMEKALGANSGAFDKYGISAIKAKDGTTDVQATFLNAIDVISNMTDATAQAEAGSALFGRGWQSMSEIVKGGAAPLKKALESVQPSKIFTDKDIQSGRDVRDAFDTIRDAGEGLMLTIGKALAPAIANLAPALGKIIDQAGPFAQALGDAIADVIEELGPLIEMVSDLSGELGGLGDADIAPGLGFSVSDLNDKIGDLLKKASGIEGIQRGYEELNKVDLKKGINLALQSTSERQATLNAEAQRWTGIAKKYATETASAAQAQRDLASAAATKEAIAALNKFTDDLAKAVTGVHAYGEAVTDTDWGSADLTGATTAMSEFTDGHFALVNIAAASEAAVDNFNQSIKDNGTSFDVSTEKGRANQAALQDVAKTLDTQLAAAYKDSGGDMDVFKAKAGAISQDAIDKLMPALKNSGLSAQDLAGMLGLLPEDLETRYKLSGDEEAKLKIGLLNTAIENLPEDVQTKVTQSIIKGDYQGALAEVQRYYDSHPAKVPVVYQPQTDRNRRNEAVGTTDSGSGLRRVGEHGEEYLANQPHQTVFTAAETQLIDKYSGGGGDGMSVNFYGPITAGTERQMGQLAMMIRARVQAGKRR